MFVIGTIISKIVVFIIIIVDVIVIFFLLLLHIDVNIASALSYLC